MTRLTRTGSTGMAHAAPAVWSRSQVPSSPYIPIGIDFQHSVCAVALEDL